MKYFGKKVITFILTLLIVSFLVFLAFALIPGDPAVSKLGTQATPQKLEEMREEMGLNAPVLVRYAKWLLQALTGDFGTSYSYSIPVTQMILEKLPVTLVLSGYSFLLMIALSIPFGIFMARHHGRRLDRVMQVINQVLMAIPPFFMGMILTLLFGLTFHLFVPGGYVSYKDDFTGFLSYLFFPALAIALPKAAMAAKLLRSSLIEEENKDYVRTAYSRGNTSHDVFYRHMLKNACLPVLTFCAMALADMIAGSIVVEQVFSIPGLGRILLSSIQNRDYPVVVAVILCIAAVVLLINLLVDLLYHKLDPRIRIRT